MKKKLLITLTHILIWLLLSVGHFFLAEPIVAYILPGIHNVEQWIAVLLAGWFVIFVGVVISLIIRLRK